MKEELVEILFNRFEKEKEKIKKTLSTSIDECILIAKGTTGSIKMAIIYKEDDNDD
ncbi:MAG: hypothetical protein IJI98_03405 [Methanosphaera sp.]|nr:hypothetical protein [Methanosphaera sp.]